MILVGDIMSLGEKILKLRKKEGLSQEELGERINVTRQTISNWELGETSPNPSQLKLLSKELHVSIDELLDNDIQNVLVEKVSNTYKVSKKSFNLLKIIVGVIISIIIIFIVLVVLKIIVKNTRDYGRKIEESIHCSVFGEEYSYNISYYELTGVPIEMGGDAYLYNVLELDKYNDAHQIFDIIKDYVNKNGGTCRMVYDTNLNDIVNMSIKEGSLTNTGVTIILKNDTDYNITYGEDFWLEKYDTITNNFEVLNNSTGNNCGFNDIGYIAEKNNPRELKQDWSCEHGELSKGLYRLVKKVYFESDLPTTKDSSYYIWIEFNIN